MGKPVPSAEGRPINLSFELPGHPMTRAYSFVAANAAIREAWIRTLRVSYGSDSGRGLGRRERISLYAGLANGTHQLIL
jgi:hypothetical protein